jgi:Resolvase, N terminal domain
VGAVAGCASADRVPLVSGGVAAGAGGAGESTHCAGEPGRRRGGGGGVGLYARVSSHDQRGDLDRQVARLLAWAARSGSTVVRVEAEVGSGMNGARRKAARMLADPRVSIVVVEHRDRLGRMNTELVQAALSAHGRRLVVLDCGEVTDDLVRDMVEVLTSFLRSALWSPRCPKPGDQSGWLRAAQYRAATCRCRA